MTQHSQDRGPCSAAFFFVARKRIKPRSILAYLACVALTAIGSPFCQADQTRPNILWFVVDDMSANLSCYGETVISTPNIDALAKQGTRFTRAYATSPVCSTFRSALITGMYQTTTGTHHHRSGRSQEHPIHLPNGVRPIPELFQENGYFTCNGSGLTHLDFRTQPKTDRTKSRMGKTDYNFTWDRTMYDSNDWSGREPDQPFFMQVQLHGGKLRGASNAQYDSFSNQVELVFGNLTDPDDVNLPPYYPDDPVIRRDWSTYLDSVRISDTHVGLVLSRLKKENLLENTLVVFFTDHGISHARGKQFLYDEGTHIPLIIVGPTIKKGHTRTDLVEHIDIAAFTLAAAGIPIPEPMQGDDILAADYKPKESIFAARDRCGEAADRIRSVRTDQYLYIKNFHPERPLLMPSSYKDGKLILQRLRELHTTNKLDDRTREILFSSTRPQEELYQYHEDHWQIKNLAGNPAFLAILEDHRSRLEKWIIDTADQGSETKEVYLIEIEDQIRSTRNPDTREIYRKNSQTYLNWMHADK